MRKEEVRRRYIEKITMLMYEDKDFEHLYNLIDFISGYYNINIYREVGEEIKRDVLEILENLK